MPSPQTVYLRFVVGVKDPYSYVSRGIFQAASELRGSGRLEAWEYDKISDMLEWLGTHLLAPPILREPDTHRAISWFKPQAQEPIAHVREICILLDEYGYATRQITTSTPGHMIYEDDWQIVAYPPRDHQGRL